MASSSSDPVLSAEIERLRPWRYNHRKGDAFISSDHPFTGALHDVHWKPILQHVLGVLNGITPLSSLRAIDLGCLEGHYTDVFCEAGFREVVGTDLSDRHLERAEFLLKRFKGHKNVSLHKLNAADETGMGALGTFNVVFCHGLLYHLKDPLKFFDVVEKMIPKDGPFYLLLATQYKGSYVLNVAPYPFAELQIKKLRQHSAHLPDGMLYSPVDESVFERCSFRLNPAALHRVLSRAYDYKGLIAYDTPHGHRHSLNSYLIATKQPQPSLLAALQKAPPVGCRFATWDPHTVNSYSFTRRPEAILVRTLVRLAHFFGRWAQKIAVREVEL
ncbi:MAG: methyltransferase [Candidatus Peribacteraceae bacterium]|nr:methyltransferase [Candidatus Peribacteraceae bacterium]